MIVYPPPVPQGGGDQTAALTQWSVTLYQNLKIIDVFLLPLSF